MPDDKQTLHRELVANVLNHQGETSPQQRARAFANSELLPPLAGLIDTVATQPAQVTDADFVAAKAAGYSEDQLFELVVCAAVGASARMYEAGLAALSEAVGTAEAT